MRTKSGQPAEDYVMGVSLSDQGSVLLFPIIIALIPCSSINRCISRLKSGEKSRISTLYLNNSVSYSLKNNDGLFGLLTYCCSTSFLNAIISSNSFSLTKCTSFILEGISPFTSNFTQSSTSRALNKWSATVQSLPPLKDSATDSSLKKRYSRPNHLPKMLNGFF